MPVPALRTISYFYNNNLISARFASTITIIANGANPYVALHEIAQLNVSKSLYNQGKPSTLEYQLSEGCEADVVSGCYVWEVKPITTSVSTAMKQVNKYITLSNNSLLAGGMLAPIEQIPVYDDVYMDITFTAYGVAQYSLSKTGDDAQKVTVTNAQAKKEILAVPRELKNTLTPKDVLVCTALVLTAAAAVFASAAAFSLAP